MRVVVKERYKEELNFKICSNIVKKLNIQEDFEIQYVKGNGRYVLIECKNVRYYIIVSRQVADARDAFLNQYVATVLSEYVNDNFPNKEILIYLLDTSSKAKTKYIFDGYRMAKTLGINIINEDELNLTIKPYVSFDDWKNNQEKMRHDKPANNSSYAIEDEDGYILYGKLYGANGKDSAFTACQLAQIAKMNNKKLHFIQVQEHETEEISSTDRKLVEHYGVSLSEGSIILENRKNKNKSTCRKQDEFKYNLLEKFGNKKCYLCGCDIESNIIASHIHRVTDIDNSVLSEEDKRAQAVDAENGLWLCANHDKMFENGIITFDKKGKLVFNPSLKEHQKEFIKYITDNFQVRDDHLTDTFVKYLLIHNKRVKLGL